MLSICDVAEGRHRLPDTSLVPLRFLCCLLTAVLGAGLDTLCFSSPGTEGVFSLGTGKSSSVGEQEASSRSGSILNLQGGAYEKQKRACVLRDHC